MCVHSRSFNPRSWQPVIGIAVDSQWLYLVNMPHGAYHSPLACEGMLHQVIRKAITSVLLPWKCVKWCLVRWWLQAPRAGINCSPCCHGPQCGISAIKGNKGRRHLNQRVNHFYMIFAVSVDLFNLCIDGSKVSCSPTEIELILNCATCVWWAFGPVMTHCIHMPYIALFNCMTKWQCQKHCVA